MESSLQICLLDEFQVKVNARLIEESAWKRRHAKHLVKLLALSPHTKISS